MTAVWQRFEKRESIRLLNKYLIEITQNHKDMLLEYVSFFQGKHKSLKEYRMQTRDYKFPGFNPEHVEKAMQIANENGWIKECLILFDHFCDNYLAVHNPVIKQPVRSAIESGKKLNFDGNVGNLLKNIAFGKKIHGEDWYKDYWLAFYLVPKQITTRNIVEVLYDITETEAKNIRRTTHMNRTNIISFIGSRLVSYHYSRSEQRMCFDRKICLDSSYTTYTGIPNESKNSAAYVYYFYRAIIWNDIESAKRIQSKHDINLTKVSRHPHPIEEYLNYGKIVERPMLDFLIEIFGVKDSLWNIHRTGLLELGFDTIRHLISKGATVYSMDIWNRLWKTPLNDKMIGSQEEFERLLDGTDPSLFTNIMEVLFDDFYMIEKKVDPEAKRLILLAWRYGSGLLSTLPKEILQLIFAYLDSRPLFIRYAHLIMKRKIIEIFRVPRKTLESTDHVARFIRDYSTVFSNPWKMLQEYETMDAIKRDAKYIEEIFMANINKPINFPVSKIFICFCKHGTSDETLNRILEDKYRRHYNYSNIPLLEYAALGRNVKLLQLYYKNPANYHTLPQSKIFNSILQFKVDKITFEEAFELAKEVQQSVTPE